MGLVVFVACGAACGLACIVVDLLVSCSISWPLKFSPAQTRDCAPSV